MGTTASVEVPARGAALVKQLAGAGWQADTVVHQSRTSADGSLSAGELVVDKWSPARRTVVTVSLTTAPPQPICAASDGLSNTVESACPLCPRHFNLVAKMGTEHVEAVSYELLWRASLLDSESDLFARQPELCDEHRLAHERLRVTFGLRDHHGATVVMEQLTCDLSSAFVAGNVSNDDVVDIGASMVSALRVYHRVTGRAHNDVAPQNVCLRSTSSPYRPALVDFENDSRLEDCSKYGDVECSPGRPVYAPYHCHTAIAELVPSAQDDLEALGYVMLHLVSWERDVDGVPLSGPDDVAVGETTSLSDSVVAPNRDWWHAAATGKHGSTALLEGKLKAVAALAAAKSGSAESRLAAYFRRVYDIDRFDMEVQCASRMPYDELIADLRGKGWSGAQARDGPGELCCTGF